jgi:hypothetical protein
VGVAGRVLNFNYHYQIFKNHPRMITLMCKPRRKSRAQEKGRKRPSWNSTDNPNSLLYSSKTALIQLVLLITLIYAGFIKLKVCYFYQNPKLIAYTWPLSSHYIVNFRICNQKSSLAQLRVTSLMSRWISNQSLQKYFLVFQLACLIIGFTVGSIICNCCKTLSIIRHNLMMF